MSDVKTARRKPGANIGELPKNSRKLVRAKHHLPNSYEVRGDTALINLTNEAGAVVAQAIVDIEDIKPVLFSRRWRAAYSESGEVIGVQGCHYAVDRRRKSNERLGRLIMDATRSEIVRYKNGNGLDCRRSNLYVVKRPR